MTGCQVPVGAVENGSVVFQAAVGAFFSVHGSGSKARQLSRDRDRHLRGRLVLRQHPSKPSAQALLRLVRDRDHPRRLARAPRFEGAPDARAMLVVPARFHQDPADQCIAHLGDAPAPMLLAAGVLAGHQAQERHQRAGRAEATEVMQLRENQHGGQRVDAAETAEPPDRLAIWRLLGELRQARVQLHEAGLRVIDRQLIVVDHRAFSRVGPRQTVDPATVRLRPIPSRVVQPAPQQQLAEPMATPLQVLTCIVARPGQIAPGLVGRRRRLHNRQESRAPELGQLARVAPIRLDALARLPRHQGRGNDVARDPIRRHLPLQRVPARAGFVEDLDGSRRIALELAHHPPDRTRLVGQLPRHRRRCRPDHHRDEEILLVSIDSDVRSNLFHDRLLSMRLWRRKALTRDIGGHRPPCRVQQHYDVTIAGRSFHIG